LKFCGGRVVSLHIFDMGIAITTFKVFSLLHVIGDIMGEDIITSYLLILVGSMAFFAGYLDIAKD
jgi:hypothetical protein